MFYQATQRPEALLRRSTNYLNDSIQMYDSPQVPAGSAEGIEVGCDSVTINKQEILI